MGGFFVFSYQFEYNKMENGKWLQPNYRDVPSEPDLNNLKPPSITRRILTTFQQTGVKIVTEAGNHDSSPNNIPWMAKEITSQVNYLTNDLTERNALNKDIPRFVRGFLNDLNITAIMPESVGDITYIATALARKPQLASDLTIVTGYGGSEDPEPTLRTPAYCIPAVHMWKRLNMLLGEKNVTERPNLRFLFAPHAAIELNHMDPYKVLSHTQQTIALTQAYIKKFHPEIIDYVEFVIDTPWEKHTPETTDIIKKLTQIVIESNDPDIQETVESLRKRQNKHSNGYDSAEQYAAIHPLLFGDQMGTPPTNILKSDKQSLFTVSIGGRPERMFNRLRDFLSKETMRENGHQARFPYATGRVITDTIGRHPVYYQIDKDWDKLVSQAKSGIVSRLQEQIEIYGKTMSGRDKKIQCKAVEDVQAEMEIIFNDCDGEETYLEFISKFVKN